MKQTVGKIRALKGVRRFSMVTAYDAVTANLVDAAGVECVLVGDSLSNTALGYENTLPIKMQEMLYHTSAVKRGTKSALIIADMPFMSYQLSEEQGLTNAGRFLQEVGADAVKVEGGVPRAALIKRMVENGIPVLAHIGLLPQSIKAAGLKMRGDDPESIAALIADAKAVEAAGAFAVVLECVMPEVTRRITAELSIPTVGIGAGPDCDAQVLVFSDLVGLTEKAPPFAKAFCNARELIGQGIVDYRKAVESGEFPTK